ncbi:RDD family protein [Ulvibacterium sp.]|uniref:RDD family protein n=1 Tax=Ulvibacterium sp. TaxID=2665914 RepID=UPI0026296CD6|nr:RDD family protein [Ulvibacterium sp.]
MIIFNKSNLLRRIVAGIIDYILIFCFTIIYISLVGEPNNNGGSVVSGYKSLGPILFWLTMTVGLEQFFGRTIGNSAVELKPISINGLWERPTFTQSLKRHLLDPIDMFFFGMVGIIVVSSTPNSQRLGDLWAETNVVRTDSKKI